MNRSNWTLSILAAAVLLIQGCSGYGNPPPEPMGMAVQAMMQAQTQNPDAADDPQSLRLDGNKAQQVITGYRGEAQSATGIAGDIKINIGN
ncbi:MAG: hypothetical protein GYB41_11385 [Oceanospirillales bacterium]|uniref:Lipoprotein n=1 Tax=Marinobacterium halophilum TaxID=267374 RepID=A0A2P8F1C5_9GAMM|nr:hypothetical protein [Marinobacterium halophilum]MBR9829231.1 hypothetical protein [Oceanospirillales bacterium]PSL15506.1 hypothetical protein CLV44_104117 [Marinobacterium halophilum]